MKGRSIIAALAASALAATGVPALATAHSHTAHAASVGTVVRIHKGKLGRYLVTENGFALYVFAKDKGSKSACYGACAKAWPPLISRHRPEAGHGVAGSKLGRVKRKDGRFQVTYAGHPLYTFAFDNKPDQANGQGSSAFGGKWYIVAPSGKRITKG